MQTSPFNGDGSNWMDAYYRVFVGRHIHPMSDASTSAMNVIGQVLWKTQAVFSGTVQMSCGHESQMTYLSVNNYFFKNDPHYNSYFIGAAPLIVNLDLSQIQAPEAP
jgi:hypothetical protein